MQKAERSVLDEFRLDPSVSSLILVECTNPAKVQLTFFIKFSGNAPFWSPFLSVPAFIGKNGPGKEKEGDEKTPLGTFTVTGAFGIQSNPGTALPYLHIDSTTFACSSKGPYYNRILSLSEKKPNLSGEWMAEYVPAYNYGIIMNFNPDNIYPNGSHIFLHCNGEQSFTEGCVSIEEQHMLTLLKKLKPGDKICII